MFQQPQREDWVNEWMSWAEYRKHPKELQSRIEQPSFNCLLNIPSDDLPVGPLIVCVQQKQINLHLEDKASKWKERENE